MDCSDEHNGDGDIALLPTWCMRRGVCGDAVVDSLEEGMLVVEGVGVFDINWVLTISRYRSYYLWTYHDITN